MFFFFNKIKITHTGQRIRFSAQRLKTFTDVPCISNLKRKFTLMTLIIGNLDVILCLSGTHGVHFLNNKYRLENFLSISVIKSLIEIQAMKDPPLDAWRPQQLAHLLSKLLP